KGLSNVYCRAIACDFDGTGAIDGHPAPEVYATLSAARAQGLVTLLVTGRVLEDVQRACEELTPFDAVVAENGAVIHLCSIGRTIQIGDPPPEHFLGELRAQGVPFHMGAVIIGTWEQQCYKVLELIRRFGIDAQLVFNRAALMILPSGINKAVGVRRALDELGRSERNLIAFGDAENDIPMLIEAEIGVAARGSVPAVLALADDRVSRPGGAGVSSYIRTILERDGVIPTPRRRAVLLGKTLARGDVTLPNSGTHVVISGDPRSGKSWIAGLLAEQLIEGGYQICIVDPEGDYAQMGQRPKVVAFGHDLALPSPIAAARFIPRERLSIILTLSSLAPAEQLIYVEQLLSALQDGRSTMGIPHWVVIDEAHYFFHAQSSCLKYLSDRTGSFCLVTYRPSLLALEAYGSIGGHILTTTKVEEERYFVTKILQAHNHVRIAAHDALEALELPRAGLLLTNSPETAWQVFTPVERIARHAHHARKYADTRLPEDKAFRFRGADGEAAVHNMNEFHKAIHTVPLASLRHHLLAGDFSRWVGEVLGDQQLADGLRKLERTTPAGATPDRAEILAHIEDHYLIQSNDAS
ncbi:MAG TPA: HAD hydrolase family protein, partial [Candidatus Limnocylindria bacterium]|nr:HAD hydrolase family protein [Candidatus Limnocylindria bacterium]